jgi:hypothetical protein
MANNNESKQKVVDFLFAEYNELSAELNRLRDEGMKRLNFFVTMTTSVLGGLAFLSGWRTISTFQFQLIAIVALMFLLIVGWGTFRFSIYRDIDMDFQIRSIARIRRYFVNLDPKVRIFLSEGKDDDEPTRYLTGENVSAFRTTTHTIISFLFSAVFGLFANIFLDNLVISVVIGWVGFGLVFFVIDSYIKSMFRRALENAKKSIQFPKNEMLSSSTDKRSKKINAS